MKLKIQHFTLASYGLLALCAVGIWTVSLYFVHIAEQDIQRQLARKVIDGQIRQAQLHQQLELQQKFYQIRGWLESASNTQPRGEVLNRVYRLNPDLRIVQILLTDTATSSNASTQQCEQKTQSLLSRTNKQLVTFACVAEQQPLIAIGGWLDDQNQSQLMLAMDYFSFIPAFESDSGVFLQPSNQVGQLPHFKQSSLTGSVPASTIEFQDQGIYLGRISFQPDSQGVIYIWMQQAIWVIPLMLFVAFLSYRLMYQAFLAPLFKLTQKIRKVVVARHPGKTDQSNNLTPGLMLLYKYFRHLTHLVKHDPLTGLNNREIFEERLQQAMLEGKRSGRKYALVFLDINDFHKVNDKHGPYLGDGLLKQLAKRLTQNLRETDSLARLEKDNFALLLEYTGEDQMTSLVGKIYQSLSAPYSVYGRSVVIKVSVGVAITPDHGQDMDELALKADKALQQAQKGEWPVVFFQQPADETDYSGFTLVQTLRRALDREEFKMVYQPIMNLKNHRTSYFEALLRWKEPEQHKMEIEKTIQLAEKNQLIRPLTRWIIETACIQLQVLNHPDVKIAVNLSMIDLHDDELPHQIEKTLALCGVEPHQLMIEITEGQIMQEPDQVIDILEQLAAMGISLSIDDFGTGQASLTYLKKLPVEKLKIDQSFVKDMVSNDEDSAIVQATINLAHTLGIDVVAEGVESVEIHDLLVEMGCDYVQGYYISRPLEQDQILPWCDLVQAAAAS